jgi:hypothetical protein
MSWSRLIVGGAAVALALAAAPAADAASVQSFRAFVSRDAVQYRIVLCAPVGTRVVFTTRLDARGGRTYVLAPWTGRQKHVCPTWRFAERIRVPAGRYTTQVRIDAGRRHLRTRRVAVVLP